MSATNPCLTCGACCALFRVSFYWREVDPASGGTVPPELTEPVDDFRLCMKGTGQKPVRCAALRGEIGQSVFCTIYEHRPTPCHEFTVGDERCTQARAAYGLPPLCCNDPGESPLSPGDFEHDTPRRAA